MGVGLVVDAEPHDGLHPPTLPWLHKPTAVAQVERIVGASAQRTRSPLAGFQPAVAGSVRALRTGTFVFLVSDFLRVPGGRGLGRRAGSGMRPRSRSSSRTRPGSRASPHVAGVCLPLTDAAGRLRPVFLTRREAARRRAENESRFASILARLEELGLEPVVVETSEPDAVHVALLAWAEGRRSTFAWTA